MENDEIEDYQTRLKVQENSKRIDRIFQVLEDIYLRLNHIERHITRGKNEKTKSKTL